MNNQMERYAVHQMPVEQKYTDFEKFIKTNRKGEDSESLAFEFMQLLRDYCNNYINDHTYRGEQYFEVRITNDGGRHQELSYRDVCLEGRWGAYPQSPIIFKSFKAAKLAIEILGSSQKYKEIAKIFFGIKG